MLSWLSGAPADGDQPEHGDSSVLHSQPDTPAHIFAARAFKYRLWGTPKPETKAPRQRTQAARNDRLRALQTKSDEFLASPSKPNGILLTPGTNLRRSKTVTFPAHYSEQGKKQELRLGEKPQNRPTPDKMKIAGLDLPASTGKQSAFTERLQSARSTKQDEQPKPGDAQKVTQSLPSDSTDWRSRYEAYTARTERETRKLIAKQQAAKHYAREADERATGLAEQLAAEQTRAAALEARVDTLTAELARLKTQLATSAKREERTLEQRFEAVRVSPVRPARRPSPKEDTWVAALAPSTPSRTPLEVLRRTTGRTPRTQLRAGEDKENAAPLEASPRKVLDADRRAAAAARIAARRRDKALARGI